MGECVFKCTAYGTGSRFDGFVRIWHEVDHHNHIPICGMDHILNSRDGVKQINRSLVEMANSFGASPIDAFFKIYFWAALPEILGGVRIGIIRAVKGVIIGQLLISIVGFGALFELYSANFLMGHFWAVLLVLFGLAFSISEFLAYLERKVAYYAAKR